MSGIRFVQFSDLHLDCKLLRSKLQLPAEKRAQINRDIQQGLACAVEIARDENADVVLVPGDLWDDESVSFESATFIYDRLASLAPVPVLIAPGNHDPYNRFSYHHPAYYREKVGKPHPANVHIFRSQQLEPVLVNSIENVAFYGCCFEENKPRRERLLAAFKPKQKMDNTDDPINVLIMHASQDDQLRPSEDQVITAPFSARELLDTGFDYAAFGHYHRFSVIEDITGHVRGAYAGVPVARGLDETGEHYVLSGEIGRGGVLPRTLKKHVVDKRRIVRVPVQIDSTVTNTAAAKELVCAALDAANIAKNDIAYVELHGRTHPEIGKFDFDRSWCDEQCFHVVVDQAALEAEYDLDALLADETSNKRIEGRFAARMKALLEQSVDDADRQRLLRSAMAYGLDALNGREVQPRNVY